MDLSFCKGEQGGDWGGHRWVLVRTRGWEYTALWGLRDEGGRLHADKDVVYLELPYG